MLEGIDQQIERSERVRQVVDGVKVVPASTVGALDGAVSDVHTSVSSTWDLSELLTTAQLAR